MKNPVTLFQEKLNVSRENAAWRVIGTVAVLFSAVALLAVGIATYPTAENITQTIPLLPGNHIQVVEIRDGDVMVNRDQFLLATKNNASFVALGNRSVVYMTRIGGVGYRYEEEFAHDNAFYHNVSANIENGVMIRGMRRNLSDMIFFYTVLPAIAYFTLLLTFVQLENKRVSDWGDDARYIYVWF